MLRLSVRGFVLKKAIILSLLFLGWHQSHVLTFGVEAGLPLKSVCPNARGIMPCTCMISSYKGLEISCRYAEVDQVNNALSTFKQVPYNISTITIRNPTIGRLTDDIFQGIEAKELTIINAKITELDKYSLSSMRGKLEELHLNDNELREVPTLALKMLSKLIHLHLHNNKIEAINYMAFEGLERLQYIYLSGNQIQHIHKHAFRGVSNLKSLNLGSNSLQDIPANTFQNLISLKDLYLGGNDIKDINSGTFKGLHQLNHLYLHHNHLSNLQNNIFSDLKYLYTLSLDKNNITKISDGAFIGLAKLGILRLNSNQLDHIPSQALQPLQNLVGLELSYNLISHLAKDAFKDCGSKLTSLRLDHNGLQGITIESLEGLHSLKSLGLAYNNITTLAEEMVEPILDTVYEIFIIHNPMICSCDILWLQKYIKKSYHGVAYCKMSNDESHKISSLTIEDLHCNDFDINNVWPWLYSVYSDAVTWLSTNINL